MSMSSGFVTDVQSDEQLTPEDAYWAAQNTAPKSYVVIVAVVCMLVGCIVLLALCTSQERAYLKREKAALNKEKHLDGEEDEEEEEDEEAKSERTQEAAVQNRNDYEQPQAGEGGHVMTEFRVDPTDGEYYDLASFIECYGEQDGLARWDTAAATSHYAEVEDLAEEE